ncbi:triosephosphate isomerase B-like protein [Dinothrombium tinctorium]|uniref:Triosephosphate isomerase n=1 Tax=Dinothrombium tinctorium TaxID=1965070 RepID=A0A3S3P3L4_9ACAR|nr:triosephosphate isomerase B-like protein [Dinothrombium tinctorium]
MSPVVSKIRTQRKPVVIGNWKMNVNKSLVNEIIGFLREAELSASIDTVVGVPSIYLDYVSQRLPKKIEIAAQNCYKVAKGAFTGEISTNMLKEVAAVKYIILGHVERRNIFREDNELVGEKIAHALTEGFNVIACVDDHIDENCDDNAGQSEGVLFKQLASIVKNVNDWSRVVIAYDSIQATRTNIPVSPDNVQRVHVAIRAFLADNVGQQVANEIRIIYGGCVNAKNCRKFAAQPDIDGFLVGSAALRREFITIVHSLSDK